jgi:two-component system cell cycle sensor histidine kinase/response regulator CckA
LISIIDSDSNLVEQLIINLVTNARDAMPKGGNLTITTRSSLFSSKDLMNHPEIRSGNFVCLSISDTGVGMSKDIIHRMFEPFFSTKAVGAGTGLGLSVVYGIVKQHGGWIDVESEQGAGSKLNIFLPATETAIKPHPKKEITRDKSLGNGESTLVVEDEEIERELAGRVLRENDYVVFEAANATQALEIFDREKGNLDLVFSDIIMPDENEPQLVAQRLLSRPNLKALFSGGYSDLRSQRAIIMEHGFPFLQKPYTPTDLLLAIGEIL